MKTGKWKIYFASERPIPVAVSGMPYEAAAVPLAAGSGPPPLIVAPGHTHHCHVEFLSGAVVGDLQGNLQDTLCSSAKEASMGSILSTLPAMALLVSAVELIACAGQERSAPLPHPHFQRVEWAADQFVVRQQGPGSWDALPRRETVAAGGHVHLDHSLLDKPIQNKLGKHRR